METKQNYKMFLQLWRKAICDDLILAQIKPAEWHLLTALAGFINKEGYCHPSLARLCQITGIRSQGTLSRRIKKLESLKFKGADVLTVNRSRALNKNNVLVYKNNNYQINKEVFTIFKLTPQKPQTDNFKKRIQDLHTYTAFLKKGF
jgi:hypothetical protein